MVTPGKCGFMGQHPDAGASIDAKSHPVQTTDEPAANGVGPT